VIATGEHYLEMIDAAAAGGYAYPSINVTSSDTLIAVLDGLAQARSDGIVQLSVGGAGYLAGGTAGGVAGARMLAAMAREIAPAYDIRVALHTDHCPPEHVDDFLDPLIADSEERVRRGDPPLFSSHMFDGSTLPLAENLERSGELLARCAAIGIVLEVEVGVVGGEEDGLAAESSGEHLYTTRADLERVGQTLGAGERGRYLLAATFGNVHGHYAPGHVRLRPEILREGQEALAETHPGARFNYVFHGSSGSSEAELDAAVAYGVVKVNLDTDAQYAFTRPVADHMLREYDGVLRVDGGMGSKKAFDPRVWGRRARAGMAARVAQAANEVGSAGRSLSGAAAGAPPRSG
jgi:fructose-bisphosphate aldolase class II